MDVLVNSPLYNYNTINLFLTLRFTKLHMCLVVLVKKKCRSSFIF